MVNTLRHLFTPQHTNNHRPRILHPEGIASLSGILLGAFLLTRTLSATALPTILGFASSITASQVVEQTNQQRASLGLPRLSMNGSLNQAAQAKGNNMCAEQYWAHISPSGTTPWVFIRNAGYRYAVAGENLARDFADTGSMVSAWMASPTHRANIVNDRYKEIGVAVIDCKLLGSDTALVVQMFGSQIVGTPTTTKTAAVTKKPATPVSSASAAARPEVAGEESVPKLLANVNPSLKLESPSTSNPLSARYLSPLQVTKAIMISILMVLLVVLLIDLWLEEKRSTVRLVGKNLAHILFLTGILLVILIIKVGVIY